MDKTLDFVIGEQKVVVEELPKEIRDTVDFYDRLRGDFGSKQEEMEQLAYEQSVLNIAIMSVRNKVVQDVVQHLGLGQEAAPENPEAVSDGFNEAEVVKEPKTKKKASK